MLRIREHVSLVLIGLAILGCSSRPLEIPPAAAVPVDAAIILDSAVRVDAAPDLTFGRCYNPTISLYSSCIANAQCNGLIMPPETCQEGECCSGQLDPSNCDCHCNGGPPCGYGFFCCRLPPGIDASDASEVKCRPVFDCEACTQLPC